jgi:two-component system, chemotaxis family, response regulator Rcp1
MARPAEILFADDSVAHARIAREALAADGVAAHRLTVAATGAEALDRLFRRASYEAAARPDLVLLDLDLPVVTGLDVLAAAKRDERTRVVPIVVLTRTPRPEDLAACYALGANSVVEYPIPLEELAETFRRVVAYWARLNTLPRGPDV